MRIECKISQLNGNEWQARHESKNIGAVEARAATREEAIEKIRNEIRYRLELCPCTGESYQHIDLQIVDVPKH